MLEGAFRGDVSHHKRYRRGGDVLHLKGTVAGVLQMSNDACVLSVGRGQYRLRCLVISPCSNTVRGRGSILVDDVTLRRWC
jgi:hypothetical protein